MSGIKSFKIKKIKLNESIETPDLVVIEEPLEIRLGYGNEDNRQQKSLSVTMRTPTGHDFELVFGFLFTENIITTFDDIISIHYCTDLGKQMQQSIVRVELKTHILLDFDALERHFYGTSSCGICGKASIEVLQKQCPILPINNFFVKRDFIFNLSKILQEKQVFFQHTGGLHAAFITSPSGVLQLLREDVGRHNALDKVIGAAFQQKLLPLSESVLLMSSRASFELIQKAAMAGISIMACVGAPSSLAIETAKALGLTLIGFLRDESFNIYSGEERIIS